MKLLQSYLTAFLYLHLVFTVLRVLKLVCCTYTASLKLHLQAKNPLGVEFIVTCYNCTWNGNSTTILFHVTIRMTEETI